MPALMQLREGTGEEVFFFLLEKSPHFTSIFPTGRANSSDSVDKLMINHWTKDNYSEERVTLNCREPAANQSELFFGHIN